MTIWLSLDEPPYWMSTWRTIFVGQLSNEHIYSEYTTWPTEMVVYNLPMSVTEWLLCSFGHVDCDWHCSNSTCWESHSRTPPVSCCSVVPDVLAFHPHFQQCLLGCLLVSLRCTRSSSSITSFLIEFNSQASHWSWKVLNL